MIPSSLSVYEQHTIKVVNFPGQDVTNNDLNGLKESKTGQLGSYLIQFNLCLIHLTSIHSDNQLALYIGWQRIKK